MFIHLKGIQNKSLQNVPLRHIGYFELKAIETLQGQEKLFLSLNYLEKSKLGFFPRMSFYQS